MRSQKYPSHIYMAYSTEDVPEIFYGEPFTDRKSKFQAFCAKCNSVMEVCLFRDALLENPEIDRATHNILAYITPEDSGFDDDGEYKAGINVLQTMTAAGVQNCAVMVSRWFGGVLLHGDRFKDITGAAMKVMRDNGFVPEPNAPKPAKESKKNNLKRK